MDKMTLVSKSFVKDTRGANLVEYLLMVGLVALAVIGAFRVFGEKVKNKITDQGNTVESAIPGEAGG